ncbi:MAG TPA: response regulator [Bacteroidota bacterium]|nr:response regulator [Bacteroidota bacterium]
MSTKPVVLVIDDEIQIRRLIELTLEPQNYALKFALTGNEGMRMAGTERPELIILDLGLPDIEGLSVLKSIREWATIPIIILSVRNAESDIVGCLTAGADDYLVKPFRTGELLARVRTALRHRTALPEEEVFSLDTLSVNLSARVVRKGSDVLKLTATEYSLLALFVKNAGKVLTHRFILEQVWGPSYVDETQYTRIYVGQLRKKIEDDPSKPKMILTESGIGYRLRTEEG